MGGGSSRPSGPVKAPPIIVEEPPPIPGVVSFGLGDAQGCEWKGRGECRLTVAAGLSSSGAKLYREQGSVTESECNLFQADATKVQNNQMAFEEFKSRARAGKYFIPLGNGYCAQYPPKSEDDMKKVTAPVWGERGGVWSDFKNPIAIRKMTAAGGYSSITKLFIKPSIPFKVTFNGETYTISLMTLFHPSPVRLENVQHDAMLTLGDPIAENRAKGSGATDAVILIPLVGSLSAGPSGDFISKVARYMSAVLQPDPATGQYKTIDIPTGNDWDLSKLFPGTPSNGETVVATGYYAWSASGGMTKSTTPTITANPFPQADRWTYRYVPSGNSNVRYIMLKDPVPVNVFDLQTVRMLPATPSEQAIDSFIPSTLSFVTPKTCSTTPSAPGRETMANQDQCDPFAGVQSNAFSKDTLVQVLIGALTTFGVLLAIYFAVKLFANRDWGFKLPRWGLQFGNSALNAPLEAAQKVAAAATFTPVAEPKKPDPESTQPKQQLAPYKSSAITARRPPTAAPTKPEDVVLIEEAGKQAEEEAKKRAEEEAAAIEKARIEAEAKAKADAEAIEKARVEAEAKAKADADAIEKARLEAEADRDAEAERVRREAREAAPIPSDEEMARLREIGPAGTGLFTADELKAAQTKSEWDPKFLADWKAKLEEADKQGKETKEKIEAFKKSQAERQAKAKEAEDAALKADAAEKKALDRAKIEAEDLKATAPGRQDKRTRTQFARTVKVPPPIIAEKVKAKEAADKAAAEAKAAKEAEEKAAKEVKEAEEKEAEIKRLAEEAAASASKAAERQARAFKDASVNPKSTPQQRKEERAAQAEDLAEKDRGAAGLTNRPSERASAAVPKPAAATPPARNSREHDPPTETEVKSVIDAVTDTTKSVKSADRGPLPSKVKTKLSDAEFKRVNDSLTKLQEKIFKLWMPAITQSMGVNRSLWSNRSVWMRFTEEQKYYERTLTPATKDVLKFKEAIETSDLDDFQRSGYVTNLKKFTTKLLAALEESKRRMNKLEDNAPPPIFKGGRRRRMKRKSTRRYVA